MFRGINLVDTPVSSSFELVDEVPGVDSGRFLEKLQAQVKDLAGQYESEPAAAFLLGFQAATLLRARCVYFSLGRDSLLLQVRVQEQPSLECTQEGFWEGVGLPSWQKSLRRALLLLQAQGWREPCLQLEGPRTVWKFTFQGTRPVVETSNQPTPFEHWRLSLKASFRRGWWNPRAAATRQRVQIQESLLARLALSTVPWKLDNSYVVRPCPGSVLGGNWLAEGWDLQSDSPGFAVLSPLIHPSRNLYLGQQSLKTRCGPVDFGVSHRVFWGVSEQDLQFEGSPGLRFTYFRQHVSKLSFEDAPIFVQWRKNADGFLIEELVSLKGAGQFCLPDDPSEPFWPHEVRDTWGRASPHWKVSRWLGLPQLEKSTGQIFYVRDGILLDPIEVSSPLAYQAIVARESLITDFSGLKPERPVDFEEDRLWAESRALELRRLLQVEA